MMRFLIVPDKFKGCMTALEVARAMGRGVRDAIPSADVRLIPLADGGDGTGEILSCGVGARRRQVGVKGPLGGRVMAGFGLDGKRAFLDMASASGLALIPAAKRNPWQTSSFGTGQLLDAAVEAGAEQVVMGVGGSATVDGGLGMMKALGVRFLDVAGREVADGGAGVGRVCKVELEKCVWRGRRVELIILADVWNPLLGPFGAAPVFAPQKGASPAMVKQLAKGLERFADVLRKQFGVKIHRLRSGGAAGGVVAGLIGVLNQVKGVKVRVVDGIGHVLEVLQVEDAMRKTDWVLTAEGQLDGQTARGKTIAGVASLARRCRKPVAAFAGRVAVDPGTLRRMGVRAAFPLAPGPCSLEESLKNGHDWLCRAVANAVALIPG